MDRRDIILKQTAKYRIFVMAVFVLYIFQSTPGFLSVFGLKPVFVLPFCIVLSMLDENWQAGFVYLADIISCIIWIFILVIHSIPYLIIGYIGHVFVIRSARSISESRLTSFIVLADSPRCAETPLFKLNIANV